MEPFVGFGIALCSSFLVLAIFLLVASIRRGFAFKNRILINAEVVKDASGVFGISNEKGDHLRLIHEEVLKIKRRYLGRPGLSKPGLSKTITEGHPTTMEGNPTSNSVEPAYLTIQATRLSLDSFNFRLLHHMGDALNNLLTVLLLILSNKSLGSQNRLLVFIAVGLNGGIWAAGRLLYMGMAPWLDLYGAKDSLNSVCQRNRIVYRAQTKPPTYATVLVYREQNKSPTDLERSGEVAIEQLNPGMTEASDKLISEAETVEWRTILWMAPKDDARRSTWSEQPGLGLQYRQALQIYDEALEHLGNASSALYTLCGTYILGIVAAIVSLCGGAAIQRYPSFVNLVAGLIFLEISLTSLGGAHIVSTVLKAERVSSIIGEINDNKCIINENSLKKSVVGGRYDFIWKMLRREFQPNNRFNGNPNTADLLLTGEEENGRLTGVSLTVIPTHSFPANIKWSFK